MANYASGVLVNGQTYVTDKYNSAEQRVQMPTTMDLALKNQHISIPDAQALRVSPLRPVDVNYFLGVAPGSATTKSYNHTGNKGDSAKTSITYSQIVETFSLPRKQFYNNVASYQTAFNNLYEQKWKAMRTRQDNAALAYLYNNRVQLSAPTMAARLASSGLGSKWDTTYGGALALDSSRDMFIANLKAAMMASYYPGEYDVVCDIQIATWIERYMNQGSGNQNNTSYQFADCNFVRTQQSIDTNYTYGATLAMPAGMFAGLVWNEGLNLKGDYGDDGGPVGIFDVVPDPLGSGLWADISYYTTRADTSSDGTGGSPQDVMDNYEITTNIGFVLPPINLASDSVCMEVAQLAPIS